MIELTEEQRKDLKAPEPLAVDPSTRQTYVLVRKEVYDRFKELLDDGEGGDEELRRMPARSAAANGWEEPGMEQYDDYNGLIPRLDVPSTAAGAR